MPYKIIPTSNKNDLIIQEIDGDSVKEYAIKLDIQNSCPICYHHLKNDEKTCNFHIGFNQYIGKFTLIIGNKYKINYKKQPIGWYTKLVKEISEYPFKISHELIEELMIYRINQYKEKIAFSFMVPTKNIQVIQLFHEISDKLHLDWIDFNEILITNPSLQFYTNRHDYVENKYALRKNAIDIISFR